MIALVALFGAGVLTAGAIATVGSAQTTTDTTTQPVQTTATEHATTTVQQTTTAPATTVVTTATVPPTTATPTSSEGSETPTWVWVLVTVLGASVIGLLIWLLASRTAAIPDSERRQRLRGAIDSWTTQGWAVLDETASGAVLQRDGERMAISIDAAGQIRARSLTTPAA